MITLTLRDVQEAMSATLDAETAGGIDLDDVTITGVAIDSRKVERGDLFVALVGERSDGHDHAAQALDAGAAAVLAQRPVGAGPCLLVSDPVAALGHLATAVLARLPQLITIGITGSSGKTSTKDMLGQVLAHHAPTVWPQGSFNNELGLPLTVFECNEHTRFLVLEMGARGKGHIAYLCSIAQPDVGLVLNVGSAHVGEFGGQLAIAEAKSELVAGVAPEGLAVLNADDPLVSAMAAKTDARISRFGEAPSAEVGFGDVTLDELARPSFRLSYEGESADVSLQVSGEHMAANAAAAAAVALGVGMSLPAVADALTAARPQSRWRMEIATTSTGVTVVNDAYNANPESVRAALKALVAMGRARGGRTWAVLGEMLELGEESLTAHDEIGRLAVRLDINRLVVIGEGARPMHLGAAQEGSWGDETVWVPDVDQALDLLRRELAPGDIVLVKASRAAGLERVAETLLAEGGE
ncbi:MAG: UDP-N-acetylmuramoyl-tripeptide--D-alanyl-D-alanine ligase [Actinobacteria bacterium]|nr:UDP-N-acetylmuramoyl-tripeptide--D-alanyl-D-alanine ligase [Actinomycetota bacterium]MCB9412301.1 UDP-N-acetylmuramoyl-tripeptide--D-alanyl-D-alanine ligase [Actinomycetota bacterium]